MKYPASALIVFLLLSGFIANSAIAQPRVLSAPASSYRHPAYQAIGREAAAQNVVDVQVAPGRSTPIDFSQTDETITYVLLADPSRVVYTTNAELKSGQAQTLFLRAIEPLTFPGATRTEITNLSVQTIDSAGQQHLYTFNIIPIASTPHYAGISVLPDVAGRQTLSLDGDRTATLDDIETGLNLAIRRGYTSSTDPVVFSVRRLLALAREENIAIEQAAVTTNIPISVVTELAKIALENETIRPTL